MFAIIIKNPLNSVSFCSNKENRSYIGMIQINMFSDCMAHGQDQCLHCIYDSLCGGLSKTDCQSIEKEKWKKLVDNETKHIQGKVKI